MGNSVSKKAIKAPPVKPVLAQADLPQGTPNGNFGNIADELNIYGTQIVYLVSQSRKPKAPQKLHIFPPRSPYFHGRKDKRVEIEEAIKKCQEGENSYARSLVITGLEGMGKSEILKILAVEWRHQYGFVYWLDAQSEANLNAQFHDLYTILTSQSHGNDDRPPIKSVYYALAEKYEGNGIIIFDNAEYLTTEKGVFGIDKYLEPEFHCKKPIFVITCRDPTPFEKESITCLPALDPLTPEESYECLVQHLDLNPEHAKKLPKALQKEVEKLTDLVEGHPLGLSLIGNAIAKAKKVALEENKFKVRVKSVLGLTSNQKKSFDDIKSDVKRYIHALTNDQYLHKSYKEKLESILSWTMERLGEEGKVAEELLSIVAHLSPDNIYVNLVQSIFLGMDFVPGEKFFFKTKPDYEPFVRSQSALVVLETNNIIKFEAKEYTITKNHIVEYIMIKIHRGLHEIIRIKHATSEGPLLKITKFFECTSSVNSEFREHLSFILTNYVKGDIQLEISSVLMLSLQLGQENLFFEVRNKIQGGTSPDAKDENLIITLLGELFQGDSDEPSRQSTSHTDITNAVNKLSSHFRTKYWVIEMCIYLMRHISKKNSEVIL
ncbi:unnamed protein product [Allacma fusca]|uniref:NB-ARC domain-containing protein n=1 Tax=Allacma fusca TaxID=39272 RepID=A0A8J2JTL8_9HEXA|nr:unnamed protein product [Allacma fusca]